MPKPDLGRKSRFLPLLGKFPSEYCDNVWYSKTRIVWLPDGEKVWWYDYSFWQNTRIWRTDTARRHMLRLCIALRGEELSRGHLCLLTKRLGDDKYGHNTVDFLWRYMCELLIGFLLLFCSVFHRSWMVNVTYWLALNAKKVGKFMQSQVSPLNFVAYEVLRVFILCCGLVWLLYHSVVHSVIQCRSWFAAFFVILMFLTVD